MISKVTLTAYNMGDVTEERAERMRETLSELWERFCAEGAEAVA